MSNTPFPAVFKPAKQNGVHLLDDKNFEYRILRKRSTKTYFSCIFKKTLKCPATAVVEGENVTALNYDHTHDSDLLRRQIRELENERIRMASYTSTPAPRTVLGILL